MIHTGWHSLTTIFYIWNNTSVYSKHFINIGQRWKLSTAILDTRINTGFNHQDITGPKIISSRPYLYTSLFIKWLNNLTLYWFSTRIFCQNNTGTIISIFRKLITSVSFLFNWSFDQFLVNGLYSSPLNLTSWGLNSVFYWVFLKLDTPTHYSSSLT